MTASAPRIDPILVAAVHRLDDVSLPIAEIHRRVARLAEELGLPRPCYEQVRFRVREHRRHLVAKRTVQTLMRAAAATSNRLLLGYTRGVVDREEIVNALHSVEDPELGMDIVELGLFYDVEIDGPKVKVIHTLTSMGCPAGPMIQEDIQTATAGVEGVEEVEVELTFDPPWTPDKMSDDAKFILGFG